MGGLLYGNHFPVVSMVGLRELLVNIRAGHQRPRPRQLGSSCQMTRDAVSGIPMSNVGLRGKQIAG